MNDIYINIITGLAASLFTFIISYFLLVQRLTKVEVKIDMLIKHFLTTAEQISNKTKENYE